MVNANRLKLFSKRIDFRLSEEEYKSMSKKVNELLKELKKEILNNKIDAEVFIGGSFAKKTLVKNSEKEVDIFVRFKKEDKKEQERLVKIVAKIAKKNKSNLEIIHGSRDYSRFKLGEVIFEIVPSLKIKKPKDTKNVTDLSAFHVKYVNSKTKNTQILREITLAKQFCKAQGVYGAESYISGFSGYALECLIIYYKSFAKMCLEFVKAKEQIIIDPEKHYKNKKIIFVEMNESKRQNPIILVDPTWKERNVLAALNKESFNKIVESMKKALNNPKENMFKLEEFDEIKFRKNIEKTEGQFLKITLETNREKGDIAGAKLKKGMQVLRREILKDFIILMEKQEVSREKIGRYFLSLKNKKERIREGPPVSKLNFVEYFLKKYPNAERKGNRFEVVLPKIDNPVNFLKEKVNMRKKMFEEIGIVKINIDDN